MTRRQLEHVIRAAGSIADCRELIVVGSQAILASFSNPPAPLTVSVEADLYPAEDPAKADLIDGSIGERSPFHQTFGYYAHGVAPETATVPSGWKTRLVSVQNENTNQVKGLCLSLPDLIVSKLAAGREKDFEFVATAFTHHLITLPQVEAILPELDGAVREVVRVRLSRCVAHN